MLLKERKKVFLFEFYAYSSATCTSAADMGTCRDNKILKQASIHRRALPNVGAAARKGGEERERVDRRRAFA